MGLVVDVEILKPHIFFSLKMPKKKKTLIKKKSIINSKTQSLRYPLIFYHISTDGHESTCSK